MNISTDKSYDGVKAFMIARVSDPTQRDALPAQELRLKAYAEKLRLNGELFSFDETAYKEDRQKFQEIVDAIGSHDKFCVVVFDKIDRFTRDASSEVVQILKLLVRRGKIELHFPSDNLVYQKDSPAADKTRLGMGMVFGEYYSAAISDNVKRKIEQKLHDGEWPGKAPIGYINSTLSDGKKTVIPDPERKDYVIRIFDLRLAGDSYRTISKTLKEEGLRSNTLQKGFVQQSQIENILHNPFYHGVMRFDGGLHPHKYQPLISKHTFNRIQQVNQARSNDKTKTNVKKLFTFSGILKCATCGCSISSYEQKGHVYMRCTKAKSIPCNQPHVSEAELLPQVDSLLKNLSISEGVVTQVLDVLKKEHDNIQNFYLTAINETRNDYSKLERKLSVMYEDRLEGRITVEDYDKYVTKTKAQMEELDRKLVELTNNDKSFIVTADYLLQLASKSKEIFDSSQPDKKNKILRLLLANPTLNEKKLQLNLLKPFSVLVDGTKSISWLRRLGSNQ